MSEYCSRLEVAFIRQDQRRDADTCDYADQAEQIDQEIGHTAVCEALAEAVREMLDCALDTAGTPSALVFIAKADRWDAVLSLARGERQP